ncbi:hypothetical protein [Nonomuraea gerenzanensis]|uniref:Uncharacterized protein n=1 Tax=Nonomuraea gerenzanensis TaxID=93944 RepID=A0A1M4EIE2_9ACTN|nr:hypothetical protein [Nonomuraea gerenzanensis]UBU10177.1 hypothetical protein LCN96_38305 [Nonomuraea gerenzanensis]SBO98552.1 hypothetical protein BN4615_P8068 [Nonomuraea gerenzanensis]
MLDSLIVPLFVTTDLPPEAELAEFGELLAETARMLGREGEAGGYEAFLAGQVFWLDRPVLPEQRPAAEGELRFAGMLGYLAASGGGHTARQVVGDVRRAIGAAVAGRYGDVGVAPAVFAIRDQDVRERTPETALYVDTRDAAAELVSAAKFYL